MCSAVILVYMLYTDRLPAEPVPPDVCAYMHHGKSITCALDRGHLHNICRGVSPYKFAEYRVGYLCWYDRVYQVDDDLSDRK